MIPVPLSALPTDNLYKFLALTGLVGVVFFQSLDYLGRSTIIAKWEPFIATVDSVGVAMRSFDDTTATRQQRGAHLKKAGDLLGRSELFRLSAERHARWVRNRSVIYNLYTALSLVPMVIGFAGWYSKVQKPQDDLLAQRVRGNGQQRFE